MKKTVLTLIFTICVFFLNAQNHVVEGVVSDDTGETLPGVTVLVKGTKIGTTTDINGKYKIRLPIGMKTLVFSFIGMQTQEIKVDGKLLNVTLSMDSKMLDEVVVVGYGGIKAKESIVGSVQQVKTEDLNAERPVESIDKMLVGKIAGVRIVENSGDPGAPVSVRIRGQSSLTQIGTNAVVASSEPLYVLDGIPLYDVSAPNATSYMGDTKINPLALINPEDIESITVLKDASASAIYGSDASNGVIIITTKKGAQGKTKFSYSSNMGFQKPYSRFKYLNSAEYIELATEAINNSDLPESDKLSTIAALGSPLTNTDWFDLVTQTGVTLKNTFTFSGGSNKNTYRFSVNHFKNKSIGIGNDLERINAKLNVNSELSKNIRWSYSMTTSSVRKNIFDSFGTITFPPTLSPYNEDGTFNFDPPFDRRMNPMAGLEQNENWSKNFYINGNTGLDIKLLEGLNLSSKFGIDYNATENYLFMSAKNGSGATRNGYISRSQRKYIKWITYHQLRYNKIIGEDHVFGGLVGFQVAERQNSLIRGTNSNLPFEKIKELGISDKDDASVSSSRDNEGKVSVYGTADYSYKDKYFAKVTYRNDKSSIFGGDAQSVNFYSFGASWIVSKEDWYKDLSLPITFFKIRTSYGSTGNSRIGTYAAFGLYQYSDRFMYDGLIGAQPSTAPNNHLTWEMTYKFNLGFDIVLFEKLNLTINYYKERTEGAISNLDIPLESGFTTVPVNVADMDNSGFEFSISTAIINKKDFKWFVDYNIAFNKNIVTRLGNGQPQYASLNYSTLGLFEGQDVSVHLALPYVGVDPETGESLYRLIDGTITSDRNLADKTENRIFVGNSSPDASGGLSTTIDYKNFSISASLSYDWGGIIILPWKSYLLDSDGQQILIHNQGVNQLDRWQQQGDNTDIPKLSLSNRPIKNTTRNLYDRTNIRLGNISMSYRLPDRITEKLNFSQVSINVNIDNIYTWYREKSPKGRNGVREVHYSNPIKTTYSIGLNVKF